MAAEQPPAAKAIEQKVPSKDPDQPVQEINPAEDLVYEVQPSEASDTAGLGMVEVTIDSICGEDENSPPGR